jgi:hypothetical protein
MPLNFVPWCLNICGFCVEDAYCHLSGASYFETPPTLLENLYTLSTALSPTIHYESGTNDK